MSSAGVESGLLPELGERDSLLGQTGKDAPSSRGGYSGVSEPGLGGTDSSGSQVEDARLKRLINKNVLPVMCLAYLTQALDKGTLGTASIMGWMEDVGADSDSYARTATAFWIGVVVGEPILSRVQANQVIRKYSPAKVLGSAMLVWSTLVLCLAVTLDIRRVAVIRAALGFFESCFGPCLLTITTQWYTSTEQTFVTSIWQSMFGVAGVLSYMLAFGFYHLKSRPWGMAGWQWMTVCISLISFAASFTVLTLLPSSPSSASFLSPQDKVALLNRNGHQRREESRAHGRKSSQWDSAQFREAITDSVTWLIFTLVLLQSLVLGGLGTFSSLIINRGLGFNVFTSQLLGLPFAGVVIVLYFTMAWLVRRTNQTILCLITFVIPNILGTLILLHLPPSPSTRPILILAIYSTQSFQAIGPALFVFTARNTAGSTKKSISYAIVYMAWGIGNGISPLLFREKWAPRYLPVLRCHLGLYALWIAVALGLRGVLVRRRKVKEMGLQNGAGEERVSGDITDSQDPHFRYEL